ncbi:hypothetical protein D3C87_396100 [compost metagenome]
MECCRIKWVCVSTLIVSAVKRLMCLEKISVNYSKNCALDKGIIPSFLSQREDNAPKKLK